MNPGAWADRSRTSARPAGSAPGLSEFEQEIFGREFHALQLLEALEQAAQLAHAHGAFLGHAVMTLGKDVELAFIAVQFHLNAFAHALPGLLQQLGLVFLEPAFGRTH